MKNNRHYEIRDVIYREVVIWRSLNLSAFRTGFKELHG